MLDLTYGYGYEVHVKYGSTITKYIILKNANKTRYTYTNVVTETETKILSAKINK